MNAIDIDLRNVPSKRLQPTEAIPRVQKTVEQRRDRTGTVTLDGDAWREKMIGPGEVQITIPDIVPWTGEAENPNRVYRATFGEGGHYRDLEHVRETLRDAIEIKREELAHAERLRLWSIEVKVLAAIELEPGITTTGLRAAVGGTGQEVSRARTALLDRGVITTMDGANRKVHHYLGDAEAVALARVEPGEVDDL